jgi:hypothetical protein
MTLPIGLSGKPTKATTTPRHITERSMNNLGQVARTLTRQRRCFACLTEIPNAQGVYPTHSRILSALSQRRLSFVRPLRSTIKPKPESFA